MGNLMSENTVRTTSGFSFTDTRLDQLTATEYTIANILIDVSGSVQPFKADLEKTVVEIVESLKKSPRAQNLILRVATFSGSNSIREIHGFKELDQINVADYRFNPNGSTALYDAMLSSVEVVEDYGNRLSDLDYQANAILFVITDGLENASVVAVPAKIAEAIGRIRKSEKLESILSILISIGGESHQFFTGLKKTAGFDQYVSVADATSGELAKLMNFVSKSISSQSQSLGSGGPSKTLTI